MNRIHALKLPNLTAEVLSTGVDIAVKKGALLSEDDCFQLNGWLLRVIAPQNLEAVTSVAVDALNNPQRYGFMDGVVTVSNPLGVPTGTQDHGFPLLP